MAAELLSVWTVGSQRNGSGPFQTLIERFDGPRWSVVSSPNAGSSDNLLAAVAVVAVDDVWAVGRSFDGSQLQTLAEHWNGSTWRVVSTPNPVASGHGNDDLTAATALASGNVWAVGASLNFTARSIQRTITEQFDGTS